MKRLGLIIILLCFTMRLSAQAISQYPFGIFLYQNSGVTNNGTISNASDMYNNFYNNLKMNLLSVNNISQGAFPSYNPGYFVDYFQGIQTRFTSVLGFQNISFMLSTYLPIIPIQDFDEFIFSNYFQVSRLTNNALNISSPQNPDVMCPLIKQVRIYGAEQYDYAGDTTHNLKSGDWYNWKTLRNWWGLTSFKLQINISNGQSLGANSELKIILKKSNNDGSIITELKNETISLPNGDCSYIIPFSLYSTLDSTCVERGISLSVQAKIPSGASFIINTLEIYNDMGKDLVEAQNCFSDQYYTNVIARINNNTKKTIFEMGEELEIGNFIPAKKLAEKLRLDAPGKIAFSYVTNYNYIINNKFYNRLASNSNIQYTDIVATDFYPISGTYSSIRYEDEIGTYYRLLKTKRFNDAQYTLKPFTIVQTGNDDTGLRNPNKPEFTSMLFTSLVTDYKGIFLYCSGPLKITNYDKYNNPFTNPYHQLYENTIQDTVCSNSTVYGYLASNNNITAYKLDAISTFTNVINASISDPNISYTNIGDLLLNEYQLGNSLSGFTSQIPVFNPLPEYGRVQLTSVGGYKVGVAVYDILQNSGNSGSNNSRNLTNSAGIKPMTALSSAYYYIFYNLSETGAAMTVPLTFTSTNSKPTIKITLLNPINPSDPPNGKVYNKNYTFNLSIPAFGAVLMKVENSDLPPNEAVKKDSEKEVLSLDSYPNPFNPTTTIKFNLPEAGHVTLKVFDSIGRELVTLIDETKAAGQNHVVFNANNLPSGVYIYQLRTNGTVLNKKLLLLK